MVLEGVLSDGHSLFFINMCRRRTMADVRLAGKTSRTVICVDHREKGLSRVASTVARDLRRVTGARPSDIRVAGTNDPDNGAAANADVIIVAGVLGNGGFVDHLAGIGAVDIRLIAGKRECFITRVLPRKGRQIIVIAGSDRLGTEYGLLRISELAGVSPWHYWGDVTPFVSEQVTVPVENLEITSKEPSVKLRGFFMNDEWPSLGNWVHTSFGGFNEEFYETVFDLLLRLRGNFLWPAMWTGVFSEDGKAFPTVTAELASEYGIVMGTSHHEPLFRAGEEFSHLMTDSNDIGYGKDWSYYKNERGLYSFWSDAVKRNKDFSSLITLGMRGERDSKILGENATLADNIALLKKTITDQKKILSEHGLTDAPKVLALYKEVEDYYHGDENTEGLASWDALDDVMLLLSDDNFGNLRTIPSEKNRNRKAGWGIYYHFDYHGDPISYEWVNSTPITKAWEQLTSAFAFGIKDLWVANVGDLRPCELPLSYFMNLAFDLDTWGEPNRTEEFLLNWTNKQFGPICNEEVCTAISRILHDYTCMNGDRRPEAIHPDTFSFTCENEAMREHERAQKLEENVREIEGLVPESRKDAFYGLVAFPALASANLRKMMILAGFHQRLAAWKVSYANEVRAKVLSCIDRDIELIRRYNEEMSGGKWKHMMSSKHVNFQAWNDEGSEYPAPEMIEVESIGSLQVSVEGLDPVSSGQASIRPFSSCEEREREILLMSTGESLPDYSLVVSDPWILLEEEAVGQKARRIKVRIDNQMVTRDTDGCIMICAGAQRIQITVKAVACPVVKEEKIFVETSGMISIPADAYVSTTGEADARWIRISDYGKNGVAMKAYPWDRSYASLEEGPSLEYRFHITNSGSYTVTFYVAPTNDLVKNRGLRMGVQIDGQEGILLNTLPDRFAAGDNQDQNWRQYVLDNGRRCSIPVELTLGAHCLSVIQVDAGVVLQKIEIAMVPSYSFYGYQITV